MPANGMSIRSGWECLDSRPARTWRLCSATTRTLRVPECLRATLMRIPISHSSIYPGYVRDEAHPGQVAQGIQPTANTPPTFLVQAENDPVHEENALFYFQALKEAKVP